MSYIILRGRWCHIIVLYFHAQKEDKTDDVKDSFYDELERVFDKFPKYHMKILLGDFNAKVGREDIFKPITGNETNVVTLILTFFIVYIASVPKSVLALFCWNLKSHTVLYVIRCVTDSL
jgi:hypothetical protein